MGEYAKYNGQRIKIGTCEDMYYLRADQAELVQALPGNVNPVTEAQAIRFRFPFPTEDNRLPGDFENFDYGLAVNCKVGVEYQHDFIQFHSNHGLIVSLFCPEGPSGNAHGITKNGYPGNVRIVQQRLVGGKLILICECGSCRAKYRLPDLESCKPILNALREMAKAQPSSKAFYDEVAKRIIDGYTKPNFWTDTFRPTTQDECLPV